MDKDFRKEVLKEHQAVLSLQRRHSKQVYFSIYRPDLYDANEYEETSEQIREMLSTPEGERLFREAEKINLAFYARVKRLKTRIASMLGMGTCYFLTLTFNDAILGSTTPETRRRYVTRFLKTVADTYVANLDFGSKNGREHYHAVIRADEVDMSAWDCNGFSNAKKVRSEEDTTPIAKYISKLTNHAIKETNQSARAIYSV